MIDALHFVAARWAAFAWSTGWDGMLAGLLVLALLPLLRHAPPQWSIWLGAIALAKFFVPPVFMSPAALLDDLAFQIRPSVDLRAYEGAVIIALFLLYAMGAAVAAAGLVCRRRQLHGWRASAWQVADEETLADLAELGAAFSLARLPELLESCDVDAPLALGVRRPAILLPLALRGRLSRAQMRIVLAHEIVHHRERDLLGEMLLAVATVCWWFHPVVQSLATRIRRLREVRCDARVVAVGIADAGTYCRTLLEVAAASLPSPAIAMRDAGHPLAERFRRLPAARPFSHYAHVLFAVLLFVFAALTIPNSTWIK